MPEGALPEHGEGLPSSGRLEGMSLPQLLLRVCRSGYSGSLVLSRREVEKVLFWRDGALTFAASSDPEDRLGALLLRRGQVGLHALTEAGRRVQPGQRLGQVLVAEGWLDADAVSRAVVDQLREIVLSLFPWREGTWWLSRAQLTSEPVVLEDSVPELVLAGVRRVRDWPRIRQRVGGPRAVYKTAASPSEWPPLGLVERSVLRSLEVPERVEQLCREVYAPAYEVYRSVWALSVLGLVQRVGPETLERERDDEREGQLGARGVADLLLDLGDRAFTGVLRLFGDQQEGALHLRRGRVVFATTRDPEMSLLVHLLRRGMISDTDHEAALRRLLTGKRIGALLAERGALASSDVERFVREQVAEVACRLARFGGGEYALEPELPSDEPVTLDWSVEDLVVAALESQEAFEPVWESLGGLDAVFRLRPEYLERLDRMRLRTLAWEIVSSLRQDRTVRELLDERPEPDYDVCRMIHALERVRVVERDEAAEGSRLEAPFLETSSPVPEKGGHAEAGDEPPDAGEPLPRGGVAAELAPELFGLPPDEEGARPPAPPEPAKPPGVSIPVDVAPEEPEPELEPEPEPEPEPEVPSEPGEAEAEAEAELGEMPGIPEMPMSPTTRSEATDAFAGLAEEVVGEGSPEPPPRPVPPEVLESVERFNRRHRVMFEELRREIGAGVRNYVQTCQRRLGQVSELFDGLQPDRSGAFDPQALGEALLAYRSRDRSAPDYDTLLESLIEKEILIVRDLLPPSRLEEIQRRLSEAS